jgi:hypothetical protein
MPAVSGERTGALEARSVELGVLVEQERTLLGFGGGGGGERQSGEAGGGGEEEGAGEGGEAGERGWCGAFPASGHVSTRSRRRGWWRRPAEEAAALEGE